MDNDMLKDLWLIGIGTGSLGHLTAEGAQALKDAAIILVPQKGDGKTDLAEIRHRIIAASDTTAKVIGFEYPVRDLEQPYLDGVDAWHDDIARRWQAALASTQVSGPVAMLVWGDPALYDSTIRIAARLAPQPSVRVVPGISAIQALTAAHTLPLNTINGVVAITTGRRLRNAGWPEGAETVVVMLDGECSFTRLPPEGLMIWWGAFLGMEEQILDHGLVQDVADRIISTRQLARNEHGWIMDIYILRRDYVQNAA
ncbi:MULTISPECIES: precorrin-6A synthase (deacetylating) [Roseobacteraceae]|jgi:precorrin-6A synthase|uniref:Precorrin-6A synthase [deacetylating] n=1 Tax=Pseudosulfitobacter pseudonitzschiae TaxID=1402135 RepID=A0A221K3L6_9RHOB|nr:MULTISPECIES: precorrin-6A synthase (deacetylating) [Roseobacteraceae]ASM73591.1 precorrin 6A synthase [Pseudosulfitobacter pseudonitzschiae]